MPILSEVEFEFREAEKTFRAAKEEFELMRSRRNAPPRSIDKARTTSERAQSRLTEVGEALGAARAANEHRGALAVFEKAAARALAIHAAAVDESAAWFQGLAPVIRAAQKASAAVHEALDAVPVAARSSLGLLVLPYALDNLNANATPSEVAFYLGKVLAARELAVSLSTRGVDTPRKIKLPDGPRSWDVFPDTTSRSGVWPPYDAR